MSPDRRRLSGPGRLSRPVGRVRAIITRHCTSRVDGEFSGIGNSRTTDRRETALLMGCYAGAIVIEPADLEPIEPTYDENGIDREQIRRMLDLAPEARLRREGSGAAVGRVDVDESRKRSARFQGGQRGRGFPFCWATINTASSGTERPLPPRCRDGQGTVATKAALPATRAGYQAVISPSARSRAGTFDDGVAPATGAP